MKNYKFLNSIWLTSVEDQINKLAEDGWTVKSFTVVAEGENNEDKNAFVLLEYDDDGDVNSDILNELQDVNEKLSDISDNISISGGSGTADITNQLRNIQSTLEAIEYNTNQ